MKRVISRLITSIVGAISLLVIFISLCVMIVAGAVVIGCVILAMASVIAWLDVVIFLDK